MATLQKILRLSSLKTFAAKNWQCFSTQQITETAKEVANKSSQQNTKTFSQLAEYRFVYPEFLPDPKYEFRNKVREKLERDDMLKRRKVIDIPEFYVGSVLAVVSSDPYAPGKENRFVGICVQRTFPGLRSTFVLRNIVDNQGIEIMYDMYNPTILSIDVLCLEKRLDDELLYLRDAPPEFSTFSFDMEQEFIIEGEPVRLNPLKIKLNPPPWCRKWELYNLNGVDLECFEKLPLKRRQIAKRLAAPWENYDLMKQYRRSIPEEDQSEIWEDVNAERSSFPKRQHAWKRMLQKSKSKGF